MAKVVIGYNMIDPIVKKFLDGFVGMDIEVQQEGHVLYSVEIVDAKGNKMNDFIEDSIFYLNEQAKKRFKPKGKNASLLKSLYKEGYRIEDVKLVIDNKVKAWSGKRNSGNEPMSNYLRPKTLFKYDNFESYVNETVGGSVGGDANAEWKG